MDIKNYQFIQQLEKLSFVEKVVLYGSRARGDHTERADIDLAIDCPTALPGDWLKILEIIDDADTLLKIDCVRFDSLGNNNPLRKAIEKDGVVLYENYYNPS